MIGTVARTGWFATPRQRVKIAQLCTALGIREPLEEDVTTSEEASRLITQMCEWIKARRGSSRLWLGGDGPRWATGNQRSTPKWGGDLVRAEARSQEEQ